MDKRNLTLTDRQAQVMQLIRLSIIKRGFPPTHAELADCLQIRRRSSIMCHLAALERKGFIIREPTARGIKVLASI